MIFTRFKFVVVMLVFSAKSFSAEWMAEPSVILKTQYNDNVTMSAINAKEASGFVVEPKLVFIGQEKVWDMALNTKLRANRFQGIEGADSDNVFMHFKGMYKTEINQWRIYSSTEKNTTFDTEYDTQLDPAGLVDIQVEKNTKLIRPSWSMRLTEMTSLDLSYQMADVEFSDNAPVNFNDYESTNSEFSYTWRDAEVSSLTLKLINSTTERKGTLLTYENDQKTYQFIYGYSVSPESNVQFLLGKTNLNYVYATQVCNGFLLSPTTCAGVWIYPPAESSSTVDNIGLNYNNKSELGFLVIDLKRSVNASSSGGATQADTYMFEYDQDFSEKLNSKMLISFNKVETIGGLESNQDRERFRFEPSLHWRLSEDWKLGLVYRHIKQKFTITDLESDSNAVYVNLSMKWPKLASTY